MSQAAPTFCMNVPMSETRSAINRLRKMGIRSGRQTLLDFSRSSLVAGLMSVGSCCPYKTSGEDLATKDRATIHDQYRPKLFRRALVMFHHVVSQPANVTPKRSRLGWRAVSRCCVVEASGGTRH